MCDELAEAHARIGELESALALVNGRLAEATGRADVAERAVETLTARLRAATSSPRGRRALLPLGRADGRRRNARESGRPTLAGRSVECTAAFYAAGSPLRRTISG